MLISQILTTQFTMLSYSQLCEYKHISLLSTIILTASMRGKIGLLKRHNKFYPVSQATRKGRFVQSCAAAFCFFFIEHFKHGVDNENIILSHINFFRGKFTKSKTFAALIVPC